jgi:hypothetical protein
MYNIWCIQIWLNACICIRNSLEHGTLLVHFLLPWQPLYIVQKTKSEKGFLQLVVKIKIYDIIS